jgi:predicted 2-oxoglutarate/Fe(II)-dependent dioxygenase YbiX
MTFGEKLPNSPHTVISVSLFEPSDCQDIVERVRQLDDWEAAQVRGTKSDGRSESFIQPEVRSTRILVSDRANDLYARFEAAITAIVEPLIKEVWKIDLAENSGTQILRYGPDDHYVPHQDSGPGFESRYLSVVCYLNDDFVGGETSFPGIEYTAKPETGKAIIFPSHYLHGSVPIVRGEKFVIVSWLRGPVPIKWI